MKLKYLKHASVIFSIIYSTFMYQVFAETEAAKQQVSNNEIADKPNEEKIDKFILEINKYKVGKTPQEIVNFATQYISTEHIKLKLIEAYKDRIQQGTGLEIKSIHNKEKKTRTIHFKYTGVSTSSTYNTPQNQEHFNKLQSYRINECETNIVEKIEKNIIKKIEEIVSESERRILNEIQKRYELNKEFLSKTSNEDSNSIKPSDLLYKDQTKYHVAKATHEQNSDINGENARELACLEKFGKMYPLYYGILTKQYSIDNLKRLDLNELNGHSYLNKYWNSYINAATFKFTKISLTEEDIKVAIRYFQKQENSAETGSELDLILQENSPKKSCMLIESGLKQTLNKIYELAKFSIDNKGETTKKIEAYNKLITENEAKNNIQHVDHEKLKIANEKRNKLVRERNKKLEVSETIK